ncbi:MAG: response regulator [Proteobacteria bacterium]|nr:response regulator [Pseudomonadota bacterium]
MSEGRESTILVVDDNPQNIKILSTILKSEYRVKAARTGEEALKLVFSDDPPDLVLLDIVMPGMDGYDVCRRIKDDAATRDIPLIFVSALRDDEDETKGLELGANDYITKPFSPPIVKSRVRTHLRLKHVQESLEEQNRVLVDNVRAFAQIGLALSGEKNLNRLLESIVDEARALCHADAGTLYIMDDDGKHLRFEILQNETMGTRLGGTSGQPVDLPKVPLYMDGEPNKANVSSYAALTGKTVNIEDVYEAEGFDFTGPRNYDHATGYRSRSMLVIPLRNHEDDIIGVLQLLNAQDPASGTVVPFSSDFEDLVASLASQAAVALTNTELIHDLRALFYSFIKSIAMAIDEKSPYTGGHIDRVVELTMMIAEAINQAENGPFRDVRFTDDEIEELRLSAWMHDVGKIVTPEYVVDKSTKLEHIVDLIQLIEMRFHCIGQSAENRFLKQKVELLEGDRADEALLAQLEADMTSERQAIRDDLAFLKDVNSSGAFMTDDKVERVRSIASRIYRAGAIEHPYLTEHEVENLCIRKGTLTDKERLIIENHARMTTEILKQLPFPKSLARVPEFAGSHHEKLDGSGYPQGLTDKDLPLQSRIIALSDIFEALTAGDRPYRKPMKLSQAIKILGFMKKDRHIDPDVFDLFLGQSLFLKYAEQELNPEQIDPVEQTGTA